MNPKTIILLTAALAFGAVAADVYEYDPFEIEDEYPVEQPEYPGYILHRARRSDDKGWEINPTIEKNEQGNTKTNVEVTHKGEDHEINAGWGKVVDGPNKAKPTWHVGGTFKW